MVEDIEKFVNEMAPDVICEKLDSEKPEIYSSFKLTLPKEYFDPTIWPEGIALNKFFSKCISQGGHR